MEVDDDHDDCYLCRMANGDNEVVNKCHDYIKDSIACVHMNEIVRQVHEVVNSLDDCNISKQQVQEHIETHFRTQKVVLHHTLKDLTQLASITKRCCVQPNVCVDTNQESKTEQVDLRMLGAYLKIIDQVVSVYRMSCMQD